MQGTVELKCNTCGTKIDVPLGKPLAPEGLQCRFGCYEIYPGVLAWNAKKNKLKILRFAAVSLMRKYKTFAQLQTACSKITATEVGEHIHVTAIISSGTDIADMQAPTRSPNSKHKSKTLAI